MAIPSATNTADDPVWAQLLQEARVAAESEPVLSELIHESILDCDSLEASLAHRISRKLGHHAVSEPYLHDLFEETLKANPEIGQQARKDIVAIDERDPASRGYLSPVLYFKGFQALTAYRIAHQLWKNNRREMSLYLQSIISQVFAVDIHPAARIGSGILFDHATSIVIGETAVIDDHVSILHEVTLGGTGKARGDRHPKVRQGVLIGAGAKILGNVVIGECARVGAGSVVLENVPAHMTVAGVPAKVVGVAAEDPAGCMDHNI
ncbi:serine O-acetyltransferase [Puniceicoccales bacterium CK1056]|uniref:Serine acetyltransferase n=1 Tax=Oceanipulchritudo coccoides TaxID=2706888 RepID=A0A6B2M3S7_9BACT|nr:serine O-acetyltransferase [Oceanipulchritudo coccoides]NDV62754.1 serine O-acetyltransferase [Oceanipulchritudo coccoides]